MSLDSSTVDVSRHGGLGVLTLNRPDKINALDHGMVRRLATTLDAWRLDDGLRAVLLMGAGDRGFCAGGDVRSMAEAVRAGRASEAAAFLHDEYRLNGAIGSYPKPIVALLDGVTMGGGIGLGGHAAIRAVTERSVLAMPEVRIGFSPDVGGSHLLAGAPGEIGTHLALTASSMTAGDAIYAGFADHFVPSARLGELVTSLLADEGHDPRGVVLRFAEPAPAADLADDREWVDAAYQGDSASSIVERLQSSSHPRARDAAALIAANSPLAVQTALRAVRRAAVLRSTEGADALPAVLEQEWVTANGLLPRDFVEGVAARLIEKRSAQWCPSRLSDVDPAEVASILDTAVPQALWTRSERTGG